MTTKGCYSGFALVIFSTVAFAQLGGTFTPTGSMTVLRVGYSATLLQNGKVLIAGGQDSADFPLTSAELYDPSNGAFAPTGNMTEARAFHTATSLPDGRVLIAGGAFPHITGAELYDPATGAFTPTGDLLSGIGHQAVLLTTGKVLIAHNKTPATNLSTAELYDPVAGIFSAAPNQLLIWAGTQKAALLPDGNVLLMICCTAEQLYDPFAGEFRLTGATAGGVNQDGFAAALLANGKVLRSGGFEDTGNTVSSRAELYDPLTEKFVRTGNMARPRFNHTIATLGDGTVLVAGGTGLGLGYLPNDASAEIYDAGTGAFSPTGNMTTGRGGHTATLLLDGRVLTTGSYYGDPSAELYTPAVPVPAPALFSLSGEGKGPGALWHSATGQDVSANSPAVAGEALSVYTTSLISNGAVPPQVAVGGRLAEVLFFGDAPGYPGYFQVNFRVPSGITSGPAVPVHLTYLGRPSNEVTISLQ
jgi:hypothetical protein